MSPVYGFHEPTVRQALELLAPPVFELRALNALVDGDRWPGTFSGYYDSDHHDNVIQDLQRITAASGVYFTPNPCKPALLARSFNRARTVKDSAPKTSDDGIEFRKWLLIDGDAIPAAGISATEEEKAVALEMITDIDHELWGRGFPPGVICDSGNGAHLMIPMQLPNDARGLAFHKKLLADLDKQFSTDAAHVDVTTCNAARIWKLPGTMSCKGDHCPELGRVWRVSRILTVCQEV